MQFLGNNELGFDANTLGFPSIHTCHAIVYQTATGIYGFHSMGGQTPTAWQTRAQHFASFIRVHAGGAIPAGKRLYGCAFVCEGGRYAGTRDLARLWKQELVDFATALGYAGKISGYRLQKSFPFTNQTSAYVEYNVNGDKCDVSVRRWGTNEHLPAPVHNTSPNDHQRMHPANGPVAMTQVVTNVGRTGIVRISKEKLR